MVAATTSCSSSGPVSDTIFVLPSPPPRNLTLFEAHSYRTSTMLDYRLGFGTCYGQQEIEIDASKGRAPKHALRVQTGRLVCDGDGKIPKGAPTPPAEIVEASASWSDGTYSYVVFSHGPRAREGLEAFLGALRAVSRERWLSVARRASHRTFPDRWG